MNQRQQPPRRQQGVILLLLAAIFLLVGAGVFITVMNNNVVVQRSDANTVAALRDARDALVSFAVLHGDYYGAAGAGPGHLFCPDTNGNGVENAPCGAGAIGRLPLTMTLPSGSVFPVSDYNSNIDQQLWYSLSDAFRYSPAGVLNTATATAITVDGLGGFAAVIIAPGEATGSQGRPSNNSNNYLEAGNIGGPGFVNSDAVDPDNFNDLVIGITMGEIMSPASARVAEVIRNQIDAYHVANGFYPVDQVEFGVAMAGAPAWYAANQWDLVATYNQLTNDTASVLFTGCNITYTFDIAAASATRSAAQC